MGQIGEALYEKLRADVKKLPEGNDKQLANERCDRLQALLEQGDLGRAAGLYKVTQKAVQDALS